MTDPRPYRAGLGLPSAITITSAPLPSKTTRLLATEAESTLDSPSRYQDYAGWKEWNINPAKHGPERMTRPPVFLPSEQSYDELGRSVVDGVEVEVGDGRRREVEDGGRVAEWYLALSRESTPGAGPSREPVEVPQPRPSRTSGASSSIPLRQKTEPALIPKLNSPTVALAKSVAPAPPIRFHRRDWFIRRALLSTDPSPIPAPNRPTSISSLLNIAPSQSRVPPAHYVLGSENKGYELLRDRLGWEGGGLGRPEGCMGDARLGEKEEGEVIEIDQKGNLVIDLTADSDDDNDLDDQPVSQGGPGRTAPIATALKLDRLGIGYRRTRPKGATYTAKKVTHSAEEIREAQRRARYRVIKGVDLGKKGKVRWKERDKREKEDRRRLAAALNA